MRYTSDIVLQWLISHIEEYTGIEDTLFHTLSNGDVAFKSRSISECMREDGITTRAFSTINMGKKLHSFLGVSPRSIKFNGKTSNGFRFSNIEALKQAIKDNYFNGEDPFIKEEEQIDMVELDDFEKLIQDVEVKVG